MSDSNPQKQWNKRKRKQLKRDTPKHLYFCWWCGDKLSDKHASKRQATIDHLLDKAAYTHLARDECNIVLSCKGCNDIRNMKAQVRKDK